MAGIVEAIGIAGNSGEPLHAVTSVEALAGRGLAGDRYANEAGEFSDASSGERDITLIAAEALDAVAEEGLQLSHLESRRNVLVRGIEIDELVGRSFRIGAVECEGREPAEPCAYLEGLTKSGVLKALVHRGGLRGGITKGGTISVGDTIEAL